MVTSSVGPYLLAPGSCWPPGPEGNAEATAPDGGSVVLRRASPDLVAGLAGVSHAHLLSPVDVLTDADGELVVVAAGPRREGLDGWVRRRGAIMPGEAVTLLLPIVAAAAELARQGTVLGHMGLHDVELDERGAPVLVGGLVADVPAGRVACSRGTVPPAVTAYVQAVAQHLPPADRERLTAPGPVRADAVSDGGTDLDELVERVHDLAPPVALPTVAPGTGLEEAEVVWQPPPDERPRSAWAAALPESALIDAVSDWWESTRTISLTERLRTVRPRFWALGGLVAASSLIGLVAVPGPSPVETASPHGRVTSSGPTEAPAGQAGAAASPSAAGAPPQESGPGSRGPSSTPRSPDESGPPTPGTADDVVRGIDVVAAVSVLLLARVTCVREPSRSCLADVDQAGSPVAVADARVLDEPGTTADVVLPVRVESEVQRLGDSVLLDCRTADDEPASVLAVRTEAGWRLREVVRR